MTLIQRGASASPFSSGEEQLSYKERVGSSNLSAGTYASRKLRPKILRVDDTALGEDGGLGDH